MDLRLAKLYGEISESTEATLDASRAVMSGEMRLLSQQIHNLSAQQAQDTEHREHVTQNVQGALQGYESRLFNGLRGINETLSKTKAESHALHGGHVRELGELSSGMADLERALNRIVGKENRAISEVVTELNRLKLQYIGITASPPEIVQASEAGA